MDHTEQTPNQFEQTDDGATQVPAAPAFGYTATPVLATSSLRAPVSTLLPQGSNSQNPLSRDGAEHEHFSSLQQKLALFWEGQKKQAEETNNFKNHCVPLARIRKIMRADRDVNMLATETPILFAKAIEMFIIDMTLRSWTHTEEDRRRILRPSDVAAAISETDIFDFLADVIPKNLSKPTIATIPEVGSSSMTHQNVPDDQQYEVDPFMPIIDAGGQQPEAYKALPQIKPPLEPFIDRQQDQEPMQQDEAEHNKETSVPLPPQPQQMQQQDDDDDDEI